MIDGKRINKTGTRRKAKESVCTDCHHVITTTYKTNTNASVAVIVGRIVFIRHYLFHFVIVTLFLAAFS
jgi:hypothetical protein